MMKKRFIATLLVGAIAAAGVAGLTACGNGGGANVNKGEEATAEQWTEAFTNTLAAENYTVDCSVVSNIKQNYDLGELGSVNMSSDTVYSIKGYYDTDSVYQAGNITVTVSGVPEGMEEDMKNGNFKLEGYCVKENGTFYSALYNESANPNGHADWAFNASSSFEGANEILAQSYSTSEDGEEVSLSALYEAFEYSNGVYKAELWLYGEKATVSISIKDGYVVGIAQETVMEESYGGNKYSSSTKTVYNYSNFGTTTVNPSQTAKNVLTDYINENS